MPEIKKSQGLARFEGFQLDLRSGELRRNGGEAVRLADQSFRILIALLEHPHEVVFREEIRKKLWPNDTIVEFEHSISAAMNRLRQALGDSRDSPRYIETLARRGYRWMVPVEWVATNAAVVGPPLSPATTEQRTGEGLIGKRVSHYCILELLGGGGMGVVYRAEDLRLGRPVAIKFLGEEFADDQRALERFEREARAISALDHPNICTIYEVEEDGGQPFIVMQLLRGQTLRQRIELSAPGQPAFSRQELLDVASQVVAALDVAHQKGIIHRDIKPANIFLTRRGEAKLLDFGLAKVMDKGAGPDEPRTVKPAATGPRDHAFVIDASQVGLTLAGATLGTASYMSPEQVRKEPVDARSDLFSFGAVFYEMATGRQAFCGESPGTIHEAILNYTPPSPLLSNPDLPAELESIIARALDKDRQERYQSASEISTDLQRLKLKESGLASDTDMAEFVPAGQEAALPLPVRSFRTFLVFAVVVGAVALLFWQWRVSGRAPSISREPKATQLTANSLESPITSSAISPDGKYLAFTDNARRMRVRLQATGETQSVPEPESLQGHSVDWGIAAWFPDSTRFIANAKPTGNIPWCFFRDRFAAVPSRTGSTETQIGEPESIWIVSVLGKAPQKLRDDGHAFSVSPDGSLIAFGTNPTDLGDREIWLMDGRGFQARKLYDAPEKTAINDLHWSEDGQRVIYLQVSDTHRELVSRDLRGGPPIALVQSSGDWWHLTDFASLPGGRVIYVDGGYNSDLWELRIDPRSGKPTEMPRQLTNWSGLWLGYTSVTSDGKRLAFQRSAPHSTVNVADIEADGVRLSNFRRLTLNEYINEAETWTPDSHAVVFRSIRNGNTKLFMQGLDSDTEEPLVMGAEKVGGSAISPDGAWLFYLDCARGCNGTDPVMAVPIHGGAQHLVMMSDTYGRPRCAVAPANLCVVAEQSAQGKPIIFTAFDALKGRGGEIARFETDAAVHEYPWGISRDGSSIAILNHLNNRIYIVSLKGQPLKEITVKHWTNLLGLYWAADGKGWFTASKNEAGVVLLHVDLQGEGVPIWRLSGSSGAYALPSPDGRHLAIVGLSWDNNVWLMENF